MLNQQKMNLKQRIFLMEQEISKLSGNERTKAKNEYQKILKDHTKECGLEDPIYLKRA